MEGQSGTPSADAGPRYAKDQGRLADLLLPEVVSAADPEDYILAVLTDETELLDPIRNA